MKNYFFVKLYSYFVLLLFALTCSSASVKGGKIDNDKLIDGEYEGEYSKLPNSVIVKVIVKEGKIFNIIIQKHFASWIGYKTEKIIPDRIIERQSTNVDAVTGATNSSRVIMNAVQDALEKAYKK